MHQEGKLLREEVLRDTLKLLFLRAVIQESCNWNSVSAKPLSSVGRSWLLVSNCKLQGSQPACWGWANTRKEGAESIFRGTDVSIQLFSLPGVSERWFLGQGRSTVCGYLNIGPIHLWADTPWGPLVCCGLWGASGCSAQWPERGPGLTCQDLKNSNLKNIVKNKYLGGEVLFFFSQASCLLEG